MLILTEYIANHEFKPVIRILGLDYVLEGGRKVLKNLAIQTKPPSFLEGCRFFKVRVGKNGSVRMVVFLIVESQKIVPVLIRLKKDKIFGINMSMNNPNVVRQINRNLDHVLEDIRNKKYEEFSLDT